MYPLDDPPRPSRPKAGLGLVIMMMMMMMMMIICDCCEGEVDNVCNDDVEVDDDHVWEDDDDV